MRIDLDALRQGYVGKGQICEIPGVGPIPVSRAREVMGDALTRLVITNGVDVPAICNLSRHIPAPIAAALLERDPTCVVPGCDQSNHLEIDHWQVDYADDGPTAWWNLVRLCGHHHRLKTTKQFRLIGGHGQWRFVPTGRGSDPPSDDPSDEHHRSDPSKEIEPSGRSMPPRHGSRQPELSTPVTGRAGDHAPLFPLDE